MLSLNDYSPWKKSIYIYAFLCSASFYTKNKCIYNDYKTENEKLKKGTVGHVVRDLRTTLKGFQMWFWPHSPS